ncbi:MAG TPA: hypothetical protein VFG35_04515 [Actinoplanes sp.]|nr:hypothetical protein [Actinoplanes sp.]
MRLLVTGATGSGTTTLGRALASSYSVPHADTDDYLWMPTSPPYIRKRPAARRVALMASVFLPRESWILSGSVIGWDRELVDLLDGVVFLAVDSTIRMGRLHDRQVLRYGAKIEDGGVNEAAHRDFMDWARGYDDDGSDVSRTAHEKWLSGLLCPILRLDSADSVGVMLTTVDRWFCEHGNGDPGILAG